MNTDKNKFEFKLGELFSGPGGIGLGAKMARVESGNKILRIEHAWATDYHEDTCRTYADNICCGKQETVVCEDIRKLGAENFKRLKDISDIDALAFGFPCNDFSLVGEQRGVEGEFGPLYSYGIQALKIFRPMWFIAENVGGLKSANDGFAFQTILKEMSEAGYKITPHLYKFEEYGIPQARHRIIIVGIRNDVDCEFKVPSPEPYKDADNSARTALEVPPIPHDAPNHEMPRHTMQVVERLKHIKPGENAFNANLPEHLKLNVRGAKISQIYRRLHPEKPAYTITGSGGGGTHVYHWSDPRALTNRERARLQTFPDEFVFHGSKESVRRQIGMAVPPKGAQIIFEAILKCFAGLNYPSVSANITQCSNPSPTGEEKCQFDLLMEAI